MRTLARSFAVLTAYLVAVAVVYWVLTDEEAGTLLLLGSAATLALVALYVWRRGGASAEASPPEDDPDAEPRQAAGTPVGIFPFQSAWPVVLVVGIVVIAVGVVSTAILLPFGAAVAAVAVVGLMRESRA